MAALVADTASTTTTYTDATATQAGTIYAYQVKAIRGEDRSQASGQAQVQLPHDPVDLAPTGLTAVVLTASLVVVGEDSTATTPISVSLRWSAPTEDADSVTGYEVLRAVGDGEIATLVADTGSTSAFYTDATATQSGTSYTYKVKAIRGEDRSQASGQARIQLPHDPVDLAPSDLTAEAVDGGGVDLSWTAPAEDAGSVTGYEVQRAVGEGDMATLAADTASTDTTYADATATGEGETYAYRVKAIRGEARSQASNRVSLIPVEPPATPENLKPTNLTFEIREDGVTLAWDAPAADADSVTGYRVVRRRPNQGENQWLVWKWDTGSTETTYKDGYARTHGEYYVYRVRALRGDDYSKMSNRVDVRRPQATPQTAEWAPSNLQAQMYFEVALGEEGVTEKVKLTWDAPAEGAEWVRGYEVQRATCDGGFAALAADTGSTETAYADATAEAGESYTYRVRARRPQGLSLTSNTWTLLLPGGTGESDCAVPLGAPETEPEGEEDLTYALSQHEVPGQEFNTLSAAGNDEPHGIWSDGTTLWVSNNRTFGDSDTHSKLYAYNMATKARDADKDFNTLEAASNFNPRGLWSDGTTMWVADEGQNKIFAYDMATKARVPGEDFNNLYSEQDETAGARGIWSDGDTMWVAHGNGEWRIHAYDLDDKTRLPDETIAGLFDIGNRSASDIWADETTIFVGDRDDARIYTYWRSNKAPDPARNILLGGGNGRADGIWSDGATMWVSDWDDDKIYAYELPDLVPRPTNPVTVRHITDSSAIVRVDVEAFDYSEVISITINRGGYSIYAHPDASAAFFMLRGLEPETEYTVVGSFGNGPRQPLGEVTFTTPHAQLDGIEISGLTHTSATVTVSLPGADSRHYLNYWVSRDRSDPERTYYLRYKRETDSASDGWSVPVRLTFSGSTDVPLSELDPGTVYDLQVYEDRFDFPRTSPDFRPVVFKKGTWLEQFGAFTTFTMPPTLALDAEMTVGVGSSSDGYNSSQGSLSPGTFDVGSVQFTVDTVGFDTNDNEFELRVDPALPFDSFTLTLGPTELSVGSTEERVLVKNTGQTIGTNSLTLASTGSTKRAQAFTTGGTISGYTLSSIGIVFHTIANTSTAGDHLTVTLNGDSSGNPGSTLCTLTDPTSFSGSGVQTFDAPTTNPCPTLSASTTYFVVIERVMFTSDVISLKAIFTNSANEDAGGAAGWSIADGRNFYNGMWNISSSMSVHAIEVKGPAVDTAPTIIVNNDGVGSYSWPGRPNPNWASGATVAVKLEVPLIDICDRSPAVAHAIKAATPSFDYCHMTSPIDLANLTELDLPGGRGTGLKAGDFEGLSGLTRLDLSHYILSLQQLPVGVFDGLDSLTHLDLSHTDLLNMDRGVFDGLDKLVELDLGDTRLQAGTVPVGVFDDVPNLEVLRLTNESPIGGLSAQLQQPQRRLLQGPGQTAGAGSCGPATRSGTRPGP